MSDFSNNRLTPIDPLYTSCERTYASLRIYPCEYDVEQISNILGCDPTESVSKGDAIGTHGRVARRSMWSLSSEGYVASMDLRDHLDWLLNSFSLEPKAKEQLAADKDLKATVFCVWWSRGGSGGPTIWPEQMEELARRGLELTFDVNFYGPE